MKNKFALCFRPVVIDTAKPDPDDHVAVSKDITVAKVQKQEGVMPPAMSPSLLDSSDGGSIHQAPCYSRPKNHSRKTISGVLKTILYETSPRIRVQNGKIHQLTFPAKTNEDHVEEINSPLEKVDDAKPMKHKRMREANFTDQENKIISNISSPQSSSSTTSTPSSTASRSSVQLSKDLLKSVPMKRSLARSSSNSFNKKKKAKITKANHKTLDSSSSSTVESKDAVFYWMVLALLATILWGMVHAIILASLWLYFIPCQSGIDGTLPANDAVKLPEIETCNSWEYKKKIIMEGLLERKYQYCKEH